MNDLFIDGSKLPYHLDRVQDWLNGCNIFPIHVEISPSSACNQRCVLCCVDYKNHKPDFLSLNVLTELADDFKKCNVKSYLLAGEGEPLLNKDISDFVVDCNKKGIDGALTSNGILLTEEMANKILPCLAWARFSIQSSRKKDYAKIHATHESDFDLVIKNIEKAVKIKQLNNLNVTLGLQQILINENYLDIYETAKMTKELGVDYYTVKRFSKHPLNNYNVPEDLYKRSVEQFKKAEELEDDNFKVIIRWNQFEMQVKRNYKKCIGLPFITQVLANGGIYPCCQFFSDSLKCFGNLNEKSYSEIWQSKRTKEIIKNIENNINVNDCMTYCRHHSTNMFLWQFVDYPQHVNFI